MMSLLCGVRVKAVALALCSLYLGPLLASASTSSQTAPSGEAAEILLATYPSPEVPLSETERNQPDEVRNENLAQHESTATAQLLDDEELADLTAEAEDPGADVVGGALNNQQLTYIVIALAAAVIVLIAK